MRTLDEIREEIRQSLNSQLWEQLKNSFLGRELIEFATQNIFQNELNSNTLLHNMFPDTAKMDSLFFIAHNFDIPINSFRPTVIKIKLGGDDEYEPFSIRAASGAVIFTNIDYVKGGSEVTLYQGKVIKKETGGNLFTMPYDKEDPFIVYSELVYSDNSLKYIKLSQAAIWESVHVFYAPTEATYTLPMSRFSSINQGEESSVYKLTMGYDAFLNIYFGDGIWGANYKSDWNYQVYFLEATFDSFSLADLEIKTRNGIDIPHTVVNSNLGNLNDLRYARTSTKGQLAANSVIATKNQIRSFVNSVATVIDCSVVIGEEVNLVTTYIKPTTRGDIYFDDIEDVLTLKGEIVTKYRARAGYELEFDVLLTELSTVSSELKQQVADAIGNDFAYDKLNFVEDISSIRMSEYVRGIAGNTLIARLQVTELLGTSQVRVLSLIPHKASIQITDNIGTVLAWDSEGVLYGYYRQANAGLGSNMFKIGDYFMTEDVDGLKTIDLSFLTKAAVHNSIDLKSVTEILQDRNTILIKTPTKYRVIQKGTAFNSGEMSIHRNPNVRLLTINEGLSNLDVSNSIYSDNVGVFGVHEELGLHFLYKYDLTTNLNKVPNFSVALTTEADWILKAVCRMQDKFVAFFDKGVRMIDNFFMIPVASAEVVRLDQVSNLIGLLDTIIQVSNQKNFIVLTQQGAVSDYTYTVYSSLTGVITDRPVRRLIVSGGLGSAGEISSDRANDVKILSSDGQNFIYKISTKEVYKIINNSLVKIGDTATELRAYDIIGQVSYESKTLYLDGLTLDDNLSVSYQPFEPFSLMRKDTYPVLRNLIWA